MYYLLGVTTKKVLFSSPDLGRVYEHLKESTAHSDPTTALESLCAEIAVDLKLCGEMQRHAYMEGYKRSTARRQIAVVHHS